MNANILDPKFKYHSSADTDLRRTFARVRREQAEAAKRAESDKAEASKKVTKIKAAK